MTDENIFDEIESDLDDLKRAELGHAFLDLGIAGAASKQRERTADELRALRKTISSEQRRQRSLPTCPSCGGKCEKGFKRCKNCAAELSWIGNEVCEKGDEKRLEAKIAARKRASNAAKADTLKERKRLKELGHWCPKCDKTTTYKVKTVCKDCGYSPSLLDAAKGTFFWGGLTGALLSIPVAMLSNWGNGMIAAGAIAILVSPVTYFFCGLIVFGLTPFAWPLMAIVGRTRQAMIYSDNTRRKQSSAINSSSAPKQSCLRCGAMLQDGRCVCGYSER